MQEINTFDEFNAIPVQAQTGFYKIVALQIIMSGVMFRNDRIDDLKDFFTDRTAEFLKSLDNVNYTMSPDFLNQYQNHVAKTMTSNLTALDIFLQN